MHLLNMATILIVLLLVGVEFSVAAFLDPAAWQLAPAPQLQILSRLAAVLGKVMPVWYPVSAALFALQTWLLWHTSGRALLLAADTIWLLATAGSVVFLVPLNTRIANGDPDWQRLHRIWDGRHRLRTASLATAAALLTYVLVR